MTRRGFAWNPEYQAGWGPCGTDGEMEGEGDRPCRTPWGHGSWASGRTDGFKQEECVHIYFFKGLFWKFYVDQGQIWGVRGGKDFENVETCRNARMKLETIWKDKNSRNYQIWEGNAGAEGT